MGIEWRYILNPDSDAIEIEDPIGFDQIEFSLMRDDKMHGMTFEASTASLQFYKAAADYLREQKRLYGVASLVVFQALNRCDALAEYEEIIKGKLNFGKWKDTCGVECLVTLPIESETCEVTLKNRFDQKVNIDLAKGFDQFTVLPSYSGLAQEKELQAKHLFVGLAGKASAEDTEITFDEFIPVGTNTSIVRPNYSTSINNSIDTGYLISSGINYQLSDADLLFAISPQLLFEEIIDCFSEDLSYRFVLKGIWSVGAAAVGDIYINGIKAKVVTWDGTGNIFDNSTLVQESVIYTASAIPVPKDGTFRTEAFNVTLSGTITPTQDIGIYAFLEFRTTHSALDIGAVALLRVKVLYEPVTTEVEITANKACPATNADLYLVHETLSRATEAITDYCMRVKSEYYGRTDSQPFSFDNDGCGGLRFLTSGLKIRRAVEDNFFVSLKELIEGLQAIDNIGMGVEPDATRPGQFVLRVESLDFFYNNTEILRHEAIPKASNEVIEAGHYSRILVGYKRWEVGKINGLDEYNSTREYRTSLSSVSNTLDITSNLVAGGYPLEVTRQQSFADSGGADTTYDNETFIITGKRMTYGIEPEQGNITNPTNIYSPATSYNFRLSPVRNLMRWYRSIVNSYANIVDSANKLLFSSGTGNTVAEGMVQAGTYDGACIIENQVIAENQNLFTNHFADPTDCIPLYRNETISYEYPMSIADYRAVKANPYGYISFQCGNSDFEKGYIKEIKYKPVQGTATFILKKKWQ